MYRVVNTRSGAFVDWNKPCFPTIEAAKKAADEHNKAQNNAYVNGYEILEIKDASGTGSSVPWNSERIAAPAAKV